VGKSAISDDEFRRIWFEVGQSPTAFSKATGAFYSAAHARATRLGLPFISGNPAYEPSNGGAYTRVQHVSMDSGTMLIASDLHLMPGVSWPGVRAFIEACVVLTPSVIVLNGDLADHAALSRHVRVGWNPRVKVADELHAVQSVLQDIRDAAPKAKAYRTIGNHDLRFDGRLSNVAPEYEGIAGMSLADHLPDWPDSWRIQVNRDLTVKHRFRGGIHAGWNNTINAGMSIACGHDHTLEVKAAGDYRGRRYGIQTGMLADPLHHQFEYAEDNPNRWQVGFVVLTWHRGELLPPELCEVRGGVAWFRGSEIWSADDDRQGSALARDTARHAAGGAGGDEKPARRGVDRADVDGRGSELRSPRASGTAGDPRPTRAAPIRKRG
jgi:hypothetical protein